MPRLLGIMTYPDQSAAKLGVKIALLMGLVLFLNFCPAAPLAQAAPADEESFRISPDSLLRLKENGFTPEMIEPLGTLLNQTFNNKTLFISAYRRAFHNPLSEEQENLLLQYAKLENLLMTSDDFAGDLAAGEAIFKGNVHGQMPKDDLEFWATKVRILTEEGKQYDKIIADGRVKIIQGKRQIFADYATYLRTAKVLTLEGKVILETNQGNLEGNFAKLNGSTQKGEVFGQEIGGKDGRVKMDYKMVDNKLGTAGVPEKGTILSQSAHFDKANQKAIFEGNVTASRPSQNMLLNAGKMTLFFDEEQKLQIAEGEQKICIQQPGRVARADIARFDEKLQLIVLTGNAEISSGGKYLKGQTIQMHMDVNKGEARGDNKTPIHMVIPLNNKDNEKTNPNNSLPFSCKGVE